MFETVGYAFVDKQTSKLTPYKKLVFTQEGFIAEIWSKGQSTKEVVKVIATYEFMRGAEEIKYKNKGES